VARCSWGSCPSELESDWLEELGASSLKLSTNADKYFVMYTTSALADLVRSIRSSKEGTMEKGGRSGDVTKVWLEGTRPR